MAVLASEVGQVEQRGKSERFVLRGGKGLEGLLESFAGQLRTSATKVHHAQVQARDTGSVERVAAAGAVERSRIGPLGLGVVVQLDVNGAHVERAPRLAAAIVQSLKYLRCLPEHFERFVRST